MRQWVFWQRAVSIHQAPLMAALARLEGEGRVRVVCAAGLDASRQALGWSAPDYAPARLHVAPSSAELADLLAVSDPGETIHVFSGLKAVPRSWRVRERQAAGGSLIGIYAEAGRSDLIPGEWLRRLAYRIRTRRWSHRCAVVLGIGATGVAWWRGCGFPPERVYEFGYFVDTAIPVAPGAPLDQAGTQQTLRLLFVGNLAVHKGVDLLLQALAQCHSGDWRLEVVGHGEALGALQALAGRFGLKDRVAWLGVLANEAVRQHLLGADVLVLPSRRDGWGVVVNEALHAGVPVIVSDACGVACAISQPLLGKVFPSLSVNALTQALAFTLGEGRIHLSRRDAIRHWAQGALSPEVAARYLIRIAEHARGRGPRPLAPWRMGSGNNAPSPQARCAWMQAPRDAPVPPAGSA